MFTKATTVQSGASVSPPMANSTQQVARMAPSRCGRIARVPMAYGAQIVNDFRWFYQEWSYGVRIRIVNIASVKTFSRERDSRHKMGCRSWSGKNWGRNGEGDF